MNREQRKVIAGRIEEIRAKREAALQKERDDALSTAAPPVIEYASLLRKSAKARTALAQAVIEQLDKLNGEIQEQIAKKDDEENARWYSPWWTSYYNHSFDRLIPVNPLTPTEDMPEDYRECCSRWVEKREALKKEYDGRIAALNKQASDLTLKIMLMDVPDEILALLDAFEKGE